MKHLLLAALMTTSIVCLFACQKEPAPAPPRRDVIDYNVLPPITQEGKNTFGCKVDGEVWVPRIELFVPLTDLICANKIPNWEGNFKIFAKLVTQTKNNSMHITFGPTLFSVGKIYNTNSQKASCQFWDLTNTGQYDDIESDSTQNWVDVSYVDTIKHIISGTFQFNLVQSQNPNKKLSITDGRFDLKYTPE
jgi:hypothetical protein